MKTHDQNECAHPDVEHQVQEESRKPYVATEDGITLADPNQEICFAQTTNIKSAYQWSNIRTTWGKHVKTRMEQDSWPSVSKKIKCKAQTAGRLIDMQRGKKKMTDLHLMISDHDDGQTMDESARLSREAGLEVVITPSMNFNATTIDIERDDYIKWSTKRNRPTSMTEEGARAYLEDTGKLVPKFAATATYDGSPPVQIDKGFVFVVGTEPREKHRCERPLLEPIFVAEYMNSDITHDTFIDAVAMAQEAALDSIGGTYDEACLDFSHAYFTPAVLNDRVYPSAIHVKGAAFSYKPFLANAIALCASSKSSAKKGNSKATGADAVGDQGESPVFEGKNVIVWCSQFGKTFNFERLFSALHLVIADRAGGGKFVKCFHGLHSGGTEETFLVNGDGEKGFTLHCSGDSGGCPKISDRAIRLKRYMEAGKVTWEHLEDPTNGGGPISARVRNQTRRSKARQSTRVVDRNGRGIDTVIFHAFLHKHPHRFDLGQLNELCGTQIDIDVSASQLAEFIQSGRVSVADLEACYVHEHEPEVDAYLAGLLELAKLVSKGLSARETDQMLAEMCVEYRVKAKTIEADFKAAKKKVAEAEDGLAGALGDDETALVAQVANFADRFAIVNAGKAMVMDLQEPNVSKALVTHDDFVKLHRDDWYWGATADGKPKLIYPAKNFIDMPPPEAQFYRGGMVFKPSGTVAADKLNLYQGLLIEPDATGSCSLLYDLITEVWCNGDAEVAAWVIEWLQHIVAHPGEKVGTSLAIRGGYGVGKSIVFGRLLSAIFGDLSLSVANHKMILGDFNESLISKLLIVLEEAAFAGDKQCFDKMKDVITGSTAHINPKNKAPITVENFARMALISNHDHFLHVKPRDRRYAVLHANDSWTGTNKFEQLMDQWDNGGASRFVHDALNHSFRRLEGRQTLVIDRNIKTDEMVRQIVQSRSSLERAVATLLLTGALNVPRESNDVLGDMEWHLDQRFEIESQALGVCIGRWLAHSDPRGYHESTLHVVVKKLEEFIGDTQTVRSKGATKADGTREQLPTVRSLPCRRDALQHAFDKGLITREEYDGALPMEGERVS